MIINMTATLGCLVKSRYRFAGSRRLYLQLNKIRQRTSSPTSSSALLSTLPLSNSYSISEEVRVALENGKPIVALEVSVYNFLFFHTHKFEIIYNLEHYHHPWYAIPYKS